MNKSLNEIMGRIWSLVIVETGRVRLCSNESISTNIHQLPLQLPHNLKKPVKPIGAADVQITVTEHHVIAVVASGEVLPYTPDSDLLF